EPDLSVVLDALEGVHGSSRLEQERAGPVDVVVLPVLPGTGHRVAVDRPGVAMGLHGVAGLEDVLDDPEALRHIDLDHLELVAPTDLRERKFSGATMLGLGRDV